MKLLDKAATSRAGRARVAHKSKDDWTLVSRDGAIPARIVDRIIEDLEEGARWRVYRPHGSVSGGNTKDGSGIQKNLPNLTDV